MSTGGLIALIVGWLVAAGLGILVCYLLGLFSKCAAANKVQGDEEEDQGEMAASSQLVSRLKVGEVQEDSPSDASANGGVVLESKSEATSEPPRLASGQGTGRHRRVG
jgi:hypothetical protein